MKTNHVGYDEQSNLTSLGENVTAFTGIVT
jgi:hypothetical protein